MPQLLEAVRLALPPQQSCLVDGVLVGLRVKVVGNFQLIPWHAGRFRCIECQYAFNQATQLAGYGNGSSTRTLETENPADMRVTTRFQLE